MDTFDYLPFRDPDLPDETLSLSPSEKLDPISDILQREIDTGGGSPDVSTMKSTPNILLPLMFKGISETDKNTLIDLYLNPAKALKTKRSFLWEHPTTGITYTVVFASPLQQTLHAYGKYDINVTIRVVGRFSEAPGFYSVVDSYFNTVVDSYFDTVVE